VLLSWLLFNLRDQQRRMHSRLDAAATMAARARAAARPPGSVGSATPTPLAAPDARKAPDFDLPTLAATLTSLEDLLSRGKPVLLGFTDPRCGPCYELLPDIAGWQRIYADRLTVALISGGSVEQNQAMTAEYGFEPRTILLQREREVAEAYQIEMAPAALVVRPDGTIERDTVYGVGRVRQLAAETLGLMLPDANAIPQEVQAVTLGQRVPDLRRPDLDGVPIDLGALGETAMLVFWSPGCTHCQEILPAIRAWEAHPGGPRLIVVTAGPVGLNKEVGLRSPMIPDDDGSLKRTFGVTGTPAAVVIDALDIVASDVARGATAVRALGTNRFSKH
jgi:thiol-disulfide isomerase/thioredoxin